MFDFDLANLGVFALTVLIPGIVQSLKENLGLKGKGAFVVSVLLGFFFVGLGEALAQELIPQVAQPWIRVAVVALAGSLAASGYYDLLIKPLRDRLNGKNGG
jgi:hypothetical protein